MNHVFAALRLKQDEGNGLPGKEFQLYPDSKGFLTIGWGFLVDPKLGAKIPEPVADYWLNYLINCYDAALRQYDWYHEIDEVRQTLICCLAYNLGLPRFLEFKELIAALEKQDYNTAADQLEFTDSTKTVYSKWYHEVGHRGPIYVRILREGVWE